MNLTTGYTNPIFEMIGYEPKTTFWTDFSIADMFGADGVKDTYNRAKESWQDNIEYMAEFAMVLNHKSWQTTGKTKLYAVYILIYGVTLRTLSMSISRIMRKQLVTTKE